MRGITGVIATDYQGNISFMLQHFGNCILVVIGCIAQGIPRICKMIFQLFIIQLIMCFNGLLQVFCNALCIAGQHGSLVNHSDTAQIFIYFKPV
ncbi:hypothetical protein D9M68_784460 [compost metagenome]